MSSSIRIDASKFRAQASAMEHTLQGRLIEARAAIHDAVVETSIDVAQRFADRTFPKGFGFKLAKDALMFELSTLYATGGRVYQAMKEAGEESLAGAFYYHYKSQDFAAATAALRKSRTRFSHIPVAHLDPSLHEASRNKTTGHIEVREPKQIVPVNELAAYQELAIKRLGKTASGWNACAEQLGGDGNKPKWKGTAMHGSDGGSARVEETVMGWHVTLTNHRPLARKHLSPGQRATILRTARRELNDRLVKEAVQKLTRKRAA